MGSVAGGGRYDELVGMFDAKGRQVCVQMKNEGRGVGRGFISFIFSFFLFFFWGDFNFSLVLHFIDEVDFFICVGAMCGCERWCGAFVLHFGGSGQGR